MKNLFLFTLILLLSAAGYSQAPVKFRYQAVARDAAGSVLTNTLTMRLSLREDAFDGIVSYVETHQVQPNPQGVFDLKIGDGVVVSGDLNLMDWADHQYWIEIEMKTDIDFIKMGTSQLLSVPYALYAAKSGNDFQEGTGIDIVNQVITNTGDLSASNELQTLTVNGNQLSISNGNAVNLPTGTTYTEGAGIDINGNSISALDVSPTNEMQTLSINGNQLAITSGNTVTLPTGTTYTEGPGIDINGNSISAIDANTTNELQTLSLNGQQLTLSNGGGTVQLPAGTSSWNLAGNVISNVPVTTNVGIGTVNSSGSRLSVSATGSDHGGNFYAPGTGDAVHAYNNSTGAAISGASLNGNGGVFNAGGNGTAGRFTSAAGLAGYFSTTGDDALVVLGGNVGIGSENPIYDLEVVGSGFFFGSPNRTGVWSESSSPTFAGVVGWGRLDGDGGSFYASGAGRSLEASSALFGKDHGFLLRAAGHEWETYIDASHDYNYGYQGSLRAWIQDTDGSYHQFSDSRLKKDIQPFSNVISGLNKLQAYTYRMKDAEDDSPLSLGFMAQDVADQFPDLVIEKEGYKSVCYDHFAVLAVQAVNEQQVEIEFLKSQQEMLLQQNELMQQQINDLKATLISLTKKS